MMEEIFFHLSGPNSALPAMVQILADFASSEGFVSVALIYFHSFSSITAIIFRTTEILICSFEALKFTPRLKDVLLRVLPILGSVKDSQKPIFANGIIYLQLIFCNANGNLFFYGFTNP